MGANEEKKCEWFDNSVKVATSRKREAAAIQSGSGCPAEPAIKRKRLVAHSAGAEVHRSFVSAEIKSGVTESQDLHQEADAGRPQPANEHRERQLFLLDLFCGTAGVTAAFRACGGEAWGIDHIVDKRRVKGPVSKVDLSKQDGQDTVLSWINSGRVDAVMLAPPCRTASRAREIPIPRRFRLRKGMQPAPLRSTESPMGLASLSGVAKFKVLTANKLYAFTRRVINLCVEMEIFFCL